MIELCAHDDCTGCMACRSACSQDAISIEHENGFAYPVINTMSCVQCGACMKVCPSLDEILTEPQPSKHEVYACYSKDSDIRRASSSGGMFTVLASSILSTSKGAVSGVTVGADLNVKHTIVSSVDELSLLRGSKYVQSEVGNCYNDLRSMLNRGNSVVFSGTPCQVAAINKLIKRNREHLYTIDFICHGVPSPQFFRAYCLYLEEQYQSKIQSLKFRDKAQGWMFYNMKVLFENGQIYIGKWHSDPFLRGFLRDLVLRPSCYNCKYRSMKRESDITIADYWEYIHHNYRYWNTDKGVSKVIINSEKGKLWFLNSIQKYHVKYFSRTLQDKVSVEKSLVSKCVRPEKVDSFWLDFQSDKFGLLIDKYLFPDPVSLKIRIRQRLIKWSFMSFISYFLGKGLRFIKK